MKKKIILSSVLSIVICLSVIAGATFALFTSEARVNIAVTSGTVDVTATLTDLQTKSLNKDMPAGEFELGGTAEIVGQTLELDLMVPGDEAIVTIDVENHSDVAIQYCVKLIGTGTLMGGLTAVATINGDEYPINAGSYTCAWVEVDANQPINDIQLSVLMESTVGDEYQGKSADITIQLIAIQGNADEIGLAEAVAEGGVITSGGVANSLDDVVDENGDNVAGLFIGENDVTFRDIVLNKTVAGDYYALGLDASSGKLTLDEGAVVNAGNYYGVVSLGGEIVLNAGSRVTASGSGNACIMIQDNTNIYINGSGVLNPQDGAKGIWVLTGMDYVVNIYVEDQAAFDEYTAIFEKEFTGSTPVVNWYVDGVLTQTY